MVFVLQAVVGEDHKVVAEVVAVGHTEVAVEEVVVVQGDPVVGAVVVLRDMEVHKEAGLHNSSKDGEITTTTSGVRDRASNHNQDSQEELQVAHQVCATCNL